MSSHTHALPVPSPAHVCTCVQVGGREERVPSAHTFYILTPPPHTHTNVYTDVCMFIYTCTFTMNIAEGVSPHTLRSVGTESKPQSISTALRYAIGVVCPLQREQMHTRPVDEHNVLHTQVHQTCPALAFSTSFGSKLVSFSIS